MSSSSIESKSAMASTFLPSDETKKETFGRTVPEHGVLENVFILTSRLPAGATAYDEKGAVLHDRKYWVGGKIKAAGDIYFTQSGQKQSIVIPRGSLPTIRAGSPYLEMILEAEIESPFPGAKPRTIVVEGYYWPDGENHLLYTI
jgi:hypothetical protein